MLFDGKIAKDAKFVVVQAMEEARELGSPTVEAEQLLLALSRRTGDVASRALAESSLDHEAVAGALDAEREQTLAAVGVAVSDYDLPPLARLRSRPGFGTSAKLALQRAMQVAGERRDKRIGPAHVLIALLLAQAGTVPRALEHAGVVPAELERRTRLALDAAA